MISKIKNLKFEKSVGIIHFVGIGGIGMSGIAEIMHNLDYEVQGSDVAENDNTQRLKQMGIKIFIGHDASNIDDVAVLVKSTAIKDSNPEIIAARENRIPIVKRSEMLAELMRLKISIGITGSHGKTTTTSLVACLFEAANLNPTVINGGIINAMGTNAYLGSGDFIIAEADESDATFIKVSSTIGVITNIDPEHLDFYGSYEALKEACYKFLENIPFYGFGVACIDHPEVKAIVSKIIDKEIITYSLEDPNADIYAHNIRSQNGETLFDVKISKKISNVEKILLNVSLPMMGNHNVSNSCAAIAIGMKLGFEEFDIINGFKKFKGVKRRFTKIDEVNNISIIDDYAHHPKEVIATLATAKKVISSDKKVFAILQPHRYSRLKDLFNDFVNSFSDADEIYITEIYSAGENPILGYSSIELVDAIKNIGKKVTYAENINNLSKDIANKVKEGDIVVFLGAGTITKWAQEFPSYLKRDL